MPKGKILSAAGDDGQALLQLREGRLNSTPQDPL